MYGYDEPFQGLVGNTFEDLMVSKDQTSIRIYIKDGWFKTISTEGDCCSESWWADILGVQSAKGGKILEIKELEVETPNDDRTRQEYDQAYGYELVTDKGVVTLVFRNSSNGYYGGWAFDIDPEKLPLSETLENYERIESNDWRA